MWELRGFLGEGEVRLQGSKPGKAGCFEVLSWVAFVFDSARNTPPA